MCTRYKLGWQVYALRAELGATLLFHSVYACRCGQCVCRNCKRGGTVTVFADVIRHVGVTNAGGQC